MDNDLLCDEEAEIPVKENHATSRVVKVAQVKESAKEEKRKVIRKPFHVFSKRAKKKSQRGRKEATGPKCKPAATPSPEHLTQSNAEKVLETSKTSLKDSKESLSPSESKKNTKVMLSSLSLMAASAKRILGIKKDTLVVEKEQVTEFAMDASQSDGDSISGGSISGDSISGDSISGDSISTTLEDESVDSRLTTLVAKHEEETERELMKLIDGALYGFDSEEVQKELDNYNSGMLIINFQESAEAQLASLVDRIDDLKSCGVGGCGAEGDFGCLRDESVQRNYTKKTSNSPYIESGSEEKTCESQVLYDADSINDLHSFYDDSTVEDTLTIGDTISNFDEDLCEYDDFKKAMELLKRRAAQQGIGKVHLLERIRTEQKRRELKDVGIVVYLDSTKEPCE